MPESATTEHFSLKADGGKYRYTGTPANITQLRGVIAELVSFPYEADPAMWVAKVHDSTTEVIAGAIVMWKAKGDITMSAGDPMAPRREAAMAILHARFAAQQAQFAVEAGNQTQTMVRLTRAVVWLTVATLIAVVVQVWLAVHLMH